MPSNSYTPCIGMLCSSHGLRLVELHNRPISLRNASGNGGSI
jgi:hypothetical protein